MINPSLNMNNFSEFPENIPKRIYPLMQNQTIFNQLNEFVNLKNEDQKIFVLTNPLLEQRKYGIGKKTIVSEFCHLVKSKQQLNIKWFDGSSVEIFEHELDQFVTSLTSTPSSANNKSKIEKIFNKVESFKSRSIFVITNVQNWETVGEFLGRLLESSRCFAILISRSNLRRSVNKSIQFAEFNFKPSWADCERYLNFYLKSRLKSSQQVIQLLEFLTSNYKHIINPLHLEKLTFYLKYNYLYSIDNIIKQLTQTENFRLSQVIAFVKSVDTESAQILFFSKYLYQEFIPIDLLLNLLDKKKFEIQNSIKFLIDLNLVELTCSQYGQKPLGLKLHHMIQKEIKLPSIESKIEVEKRLVQTLNGLFPKAEMFYYPSVITFLSYCKKLKPDDEEFLEKFADLCYLVGDFEYSRQRLPTAIKFLKMGYDRSKKDGLERFIIRLGECHFQLKEYSLALDYYKLLEESPSNPYFKIGKCYFEIKDYTNAVKFLKIVYNEAQRSSENFPECINLLGISYEQMKKYQIAIKYNLELLKIKESDSNSNKYELIEILSRLGRCHGKLEKHSTALEYYERGFELVSQGKDYKKICQSLINVGKMNLKLENYDQALSDFKTVHDLQALNSEKISYLELAEPLDCLGECYFKKGNLDLARKYFEEAMKLRLKYYGQNMHSVLIDTYIHLGIVYQKLKESRKADDFLKKAYDIKKNLIGNEINLKQFSKIEKWSVTLVQKWLNDLSNEKLTQTFKNYDGLALARVYLLGFDNSDYFKDLIDENLTNIDLTKNDCVNFIDLLSQLFL